MAKAMRSELLPPERGVPFDLPDRQQFASGYARLHALRTMYLKPATTKMVYFVQ
jgi:hypothetical protein